MSFNRKLEELDNSMLVAYYLMTRDNIVSIHKAMSENEDLDLNELRFIGSLDKDGKIEKTTENCSHQIRRKIQVEQEKYKEKIENIRHNSKERA